MNKYFLIIISLILALLLTFIPLPAWAVWLRPIWVVLVMTYWVFNLSEIFGLFTAWLVGLVMDLMQNSLFGEHALALIVVVYLAMKVKRIIRFFPIWQQAFVVAGLIMSYQIIIFLIQGISGHLITNWQYWLPIITSLIFWPWLCVILRYYQTRYKVQ